MEEEKKKLMEAGDEDAAKALEEKFAQDSAPVEMNFDDLDVFAVEDVMDLGNTMPLFAQFLYEDWALLNLRAELHLLLHNFKKDLDDADRPSFVEAHLGYYYQKYFKKSWNFNQYGLAKFADLLDILKDAISVDSTSNFLQAPLVGFSLELSRGNSDRGCAIRGCHARDLPEVHRGTRKSPQLRWCAILPPIRLLSLFPQLAGPQARAGAPRRRRRRDREAKVLEAGGWGPGASRHLLLQHGRPAPPPTRQAASASRNENDTVLAVAHSRMRTVHPGQGRRQGLGQRRRQRQAVCSYSL